jgi:23S rRNA A2030 N6-methylase RlmJ
VVVVNPPYLVEQSMRDWLPELRGIVAAAQGGCEIMAPAG